MGHAGRVPELPDVTVYVEALAGGRVILLVSDRGDWADAHDFLGAPLAVQTGPLFWVVDGGWITASDPTLRIDVDLPDDPLLQGIPYHVQAAFEADSGSLYLTNAVVRVVGE